VRPWAIVFAVIWAVFTGWTIRRLWRPARERYSHFVYKYGVKGFGLGMYVLTLISYLVEAAPTRKVLIYVVVGLPISLWGGYAFGRVMAWSFNASPDDGAV
jgi:hypothetical protein